MSNETTSHRPPSPPHSNDGDFGMTPGKTDLYQEPFTPPTTVRPVSRTGVAYNGYGPPSQYPPIPQQMYYSPQPTFVRQAPYHTPPNIADPGIMTRSGKNLGSPIGPRHHDRNSRSPKPRRNRNNKLSKKGLPVIDQPLSILTKDYRIPVRDMGAWVKRSVEERLKEVEKKKGYISRPMNSFMLYRSAYAERVKQFCKENNHQVVSQVTGQSWPMEPPHVREMYENFAIMERDAHAAAHPNYKFAPNKSGKKRGRDDDDSDSDDEWRGPGMKRSRPSTRGGTRSTSSTPFDPNRMARFSAPMYHQPPQPHPSSYMATNPHGPPPFSFGMGGMSDGYYQPQTVPYGQHVDDVKFGPVGDPFPVYDMDSQLIGMPDSNGSELLGATGGLDENIPVDQLLDPRLAEFDPNYAYGHYDNMSDPSFAIPRSYGHSSYPAAAEVTSAGEQIHPGMATLTEGWANDVQAGSDFDNEFRTWS